jgi:hypothetical protein
MDQRAHDVEEDLKHILHTRLSLSHKIELLEQGVVETVQGTKAVALAALQLARNKTVDFIESAAFHMNPTVQARRRPWIMVGGAVTVGFVAGLIEQRRRTAGVYPYYPPKAEAAAVMPSQERRQTKVPRGVYPFYTDQEQLPPSRSFGRSERRHKRIPESRRQTGWISDVWRPLFSLWDELAGELTQERMRLQGAALHAGRSFIRDVARIAGQSLLDQLNRPGSLSPRHGQPWNEK